MKLIGDIHGKFTRLDEICNSNPNEEFVGIGDIGLGFSSIIPPLPPNFKFFRGNHDNPAICKNHPQSIGDWGMYKDLFFFVAGADSIDKKWRKEGINWWYDEELSTEDLNKVIKDYENIKPSILVSHEAPFCVHNLLKSANDFKHGGDIYGFGPVRGTRTAFALDEMLKIHMPDKIIFGHWHINLQISPREKGQFICIDELSTYSL